MSSVSSTSSTSYSLSAKTGVGGLVSGMDTDELVYNLTATTRAKIAKQSQAKQLLEWKQTAYRSVTTAITNFQSKYFDVLSDTYLGSSSFFNTTTATSSSTAIKATASSSASTGTMTVNSVTQLASKQSVTSTTSVAAALSGTASNTDIEALATSLAGSSFGLTLDGTLRTITFDSDFADQFTSSSTASDFQTAMQDLIDDAFGVTGDTDRVIEVSVSGTSNSVLSFTADGSTLTTSAIDSDTTALTAMGLTAGESNVLSTTAELSTLSLATALSTTNDTYKFSINDVDFEFASTVSISDIVDEINASDAGVTMAYSSITGKFSITADSEGAGENIAITESQGNLMTAFGLTGTNATVTAGKNAILSVDGTRIVRSSNDITVNGVTLSLSSIPADEVTITLTADPTSLSETFKTFVDDYNSMISTINTLISEESDSDYPPLTDEQKEDMTDEEIASWEAKAKSGILKGDSTLRSLASKLTNALYTTVGTNGTSLYEMGISSSGYDALGKIDVDTDKLSTALSSNMSEIMELFTADNGLSDTFDSLIDSFAKTSGAQGSRGILVDLAGVADTLSETQNSIYDQLEDISDFSEKLAERLEDEEERYWAKFTAMETALSQLNAQASIITSFSSSGS